jgi:hypothetical protein
MGRKVNLINQNFGRLTVIREIGTNKNRRVIWECLCECGAITKVVGRDLRNGHTKSCGCYRAELSTKKFRKHGKHNSAEYNSWRLLKNRCLNPNDQRFAEYGGRGIKVCDPWIDSFENFYADMGPKPSPQHSIDRIDVNGHYSPENCRWASCEEQANNTSRNVFVTHLGQTQTLAQWARELNINYNTLNNRYKRGWDSVRILSPVSKKI